MADLEQETKQSFKQDYTNSVELSIYSCGHEFCKPCHTWGPGIRDHYLIHYVADGKGTFTTDGKTYLLKAGDLFLARPNQIVTYTADGASPWEYYWVGFNGACASRLVQQTPFNNTNPTHHCSNPEAVQEALYNIFLSRGLEPHDEAMMVGHLYIFISLLMKKASEMVPRSANQSGQYVMNAIKYIQFNYSHDISIDDIAASVGISRSHLYRVFISNVGKSPIDYLTDYRISEARNLLETTNLSIAEIAASVGFFDQFYFSRVFKKVVGTPPSRYLLTVERPPKQP